LLLWRSGVETDARTDRRGSLGLPCVLACGPWVRCGWSRGTRPDRLLGDGGVASVRRWCARGARWYGRNAPIPRRFSSSSGQDLPAPGGQVRRGVGCSPGCSTSADWTAASSSWRRSRRRLRQEMEAAAVSSVAALYPCAHTGHCIPWGLRWRPRVRGGSSSPKLLPGERSRMSLNSSSTLGCVIGFAGDRVGRYLYPRARTMERLREQFGVRPETEGSG